MTIVLGCGLAPGLADVLVSHACAMFSAVDEIQVARVGWAGPSSVAAVRHARRALARSRHNGSWHEQHPHGETMVWFPDPIGAWDCRLVTGGGPLLVDAFADVPRCRSCWANRRSAPASAAASATTASGARACVDVWGKREDGHNCVVYGVVERTEVVAGAVLAVTAAQLGGALGPRIDNPGVHGLGVLVEARPFIAELAERGVRVAVFEGAAVG